MARLGVRNAVAALRWHDWAHRWSSILEAAGLAPRPALSERVGALEALAAVAERAQLEREPLRLHATRPNP
jgi:hypothetical protein